MSDQNDEPIVPVTPRRMPKAPIEEIGGRKLKPATLMMGHGYDPVLSEGSLKPPIFLTSTFAFENAAVEVNSVNRPMNLMNISLLLFYYIEKAS